MFTIVLYFDVYQQEIYNKTSTDISPNKFEKHHKLNCQ